MKFVNVLVFGLSMLLAPQVWGQAESSSEETYLYPVKPGLPGSLAGTMGELRTTHFHAGIDIRTNNQIGFPVQASRTGYISRVSVSPSGYGQVIYIKHPDGNTTLYAHLEKFSSSLGKRILEEQYKRQSFEVDLEFGPEEFPVQRGDTIALSGNTGSSSGPHVHFEIRDSENHALDPMSLAQFNEVKDVLPPVPERLALRPLTVSSRINDQFSRTEYYTFTRNGNQWSMASPILVSGPIGLELIAKDKLAAKSQFFGGVNSLQVFLDSTMIFSQQIRRIPLAETRSIFTLMDFKTMRLKGSRFYKLYLDEGNDLDFYTGVKQQGIIQVAPGPDRRVTIRMTDSSGNTSTLTFFLRFSAPVETLPLSPVTTAISGELWGNVYQVTVPLCQEKTVFYSGGTAEYRKPDLTTKTSQIYLVDLSKELPDSVKACSGKTWITHFQDRIPPQKFYTHFGKFAEITFPKEALFDTLYLRMYRSSGRVPIFGIGDRFTPLNQALEVALLGIPDSLWQPGSAVYRVLGKGNYVYHGGKREGTTVRFTTRELGEFTLLTDTKAPVITPVYLDKAGARFKIRDDLSGIQTYRATLNGEWILLNFDAKSAGFWVTLPDPTKTLHGLLEIQASDMAGNTSTFKKWIE